MKCFIFLLLLSANIFAQKDSLQLGDKYAEDQIYIRVTYNRLINQPSALEKSSFSYGFSTGFVKDFIVNTKGSYSIATGLGYGFDKFNDDLKVEKINSKTIFSLDNTLETNSFLVHNLDLPVEFRWRTSTANKYTFWRVYVGAKLTYNLSNKFSFTDAVGTVSSFSNIPEYNKLQYGLTLSIGYGAINGYLYYGLSPIFKNAFLGAEKINTKIIKFGFSFYIL